VSEETLYEQVINDSKEHTLTFSYKSVFDHLLEVIKLYPKQIPQAVLVFITIWAVADIFLLEDKSNLKDVILPAILIAILVSIYNCIKKYRNTSSELLQKESHVIKKMFFKQKLGWQYAIAKEMIKNRVYESEFTLIRIRQKAEYIIPQRITDDDFIEFVKIQPENVIRLINAVKTACITFLPNALSIQRKGNDVELVILIKEIDNLAKLYIHAVDYERSIHELVPSDNYFEVHEYMKGWTDPIRDGINQFMALLDELSGMKRKDLKNLKGIIKKYEIVFEAPQNIDLFNEAISNVISS
jgi:hypothetical protein